MEITRIVITGYGVLCVVGSAYHMYRNRRDRDQVKVYGLTLLLGLWYVVCGCL